MPLCVPLQMGVPAAEVEPVLKEVEGQVAVSGPMAMVRVSCVYVYICVCVCVCVCVRAMYAFARTCESVNACKCVRCPDNSESDCKHMITHWLSVWCCWPCLVRVEGGFISVTP